MKPQTTSQHHHHSHRLYDHRQNYWQPAGQTYLIKKTSKSYGQPLSAAAVFFGTSANVKTKDSDEKQPRFRPPPTAPPELLKRVTCYESSNKKYEVLVAISTNHYGQAIILYFHHHHHPQQTVRSAVVSVIA